jgi:hypothetical protein
MEGMDKPTPIMMTNDDVTPTFLEVSSFCEMQQRGAHAHELITGETEHHETFVPEFVVERVQSLILRREAADGET